MSRVDWLTIMTCRCKPRSCSCASNEYFVRHLCFFFFNSTRIAFMFFFLSFFPFFVCHIFLIFLWFSYFYLFFFVLVLFILFLLLVDRVQVTPAAKLEEQPTMFVSTRPAGCTPPTSPSYGPFDEHFRPIFSNHSIMVRTWSWLAIRVTWSLRFGWCWCWWRNGTVI